MPHNRHHEDLKNNPVAICPKKNRSHSSSEKFVDHAACGRFGLEHFLFGAPSTSLLERLGHLENNCDFTGDHRIGTERSELVGRKNDFDGLCQSVDRASKHTCLERDARQIRRKGKLCMGELAPVGICCTAGQVAGVNLVAAYAEDDLIFGIHHNKRC